MTVRATQTISSGFGTFNPKDPITGVPDDVVEAWIEAGIAAADPVPAVDAAPGEASLGSLTKKELLAKAGELGIEVQGKPTNAALVELIEAKQAETAAAAIEDATAPPTNGLTADG